MKFLRLISVFLSVFFLATHLQAQYFTPGQFKSWTLDSLVAQSAGVVSFDGSGYLIHSDITIKATDTLKIPEAALIRTAAGKRINVSGVILSNPVEGKVVFTAIDTSHVSFYFKGFRLDESSVSVFRNTVVMHGGGIQLVGSNVLFEYCLIRNNNHSNVNAALAYINCSPVIRNCEFRYNSRSAIASGANVHGSPQIFNNVFIHNTTDNSNRPQLNLGPGVADTIRIVGNYIEGASPRSGGVIVGTFLGGSAKVLLEGNTIIGNRYGYSQTGGNIRSVIRNNVLVDNNLETNILEGGAGLDFTASSAQGNYAFVRGNIIHGNLWGITIQGLASADLGSDDNPGLNYVFNNGSGGELVNVYNNTANNIPAVLNYWGSHSPTEIEEMIYHQADEPELGLVSYLPVLELFPDILSFDFLVSNNPYLEEDIAGQIDIVNHKIVLTVPFGTDVNGLVPSISLPYMASVNPASEVPQDFSQTVYYQVEVPHTSQQWEVEVITAPEIVYDAVFQVINQDSLTVSGAIISLNGIGYPEGVYQIEGLAPGAYEYEVSRQGYFSALGSFNIVDANVEVLVVLALSDYAVNFIVKATDNALLENAVISINSQTITTNQNGEASIQLVPGTYAYTVTKTDYMEVTGSVTITNADVTENVVMSYVSIQEGVFASFMAYPNPFSNVIMISNPSVVKHVSIASINGQLISEMETEGAASVSTEHLPAGMYLITFESHSGQGIIFKLVKKQAGI